MSLRKKFILYVLALCLFLLGPMAFSSARAVLFSFRAVEEYFITDDLNRLENALRSQFEELESGAKQAAATQTSDAARRPRDMEQDISLLLAPSFELFPIRLALAFDLKNREFFALALDSADQKTVPSEELISSLESSLIRLTQEKKTQKSASGLLKIGDKYYIVGMAFSSPDRPGVLLGKNLEEFLNRLGVLQGTLIRPLSVLKASQKSDSSPKDDYLNINSDDSISIYRSLPDIFDQRDKLFVSLARTERPIYKEGLKSLILPFFFITAVGFLALFFMNIFFEKLILRRLKLIQNVADKVSQLWQVDLRIPLEGDDEITRLSASFNTMLGTLEQLIENVPDPLILSDSADKILLVNASVCELLDCQKEDLEGVLLNSILRAEGGNKGPEYMKRLGDDIFEGFLLHLDQKHIPVEIHQEKLTFDQNVLTLSIARDLSERKLMENRLVQMAFYDSQTGLPNRHYFLDEMEKEIRNIATVPYYSVCVVVLNFDRFRLIIDQLGPRNADLLLIEVIRRIEGMISGFASTFRMNGDEFSIIIRGTNSKDYVESLLTRLQRLVSIPVSMEGNTIFPSASFGVVLDIQSGDTAASIMSKAADALIKGKERGIGTITFYTKGESTGKKQRDKSYNLLTAQADMQKALSASEFIPYFQPIYEISPQRLVGFEALARWNHPNQGFLAPHSFIPLAEETGLIFELDKYIIRQAIRIAKKWGESSPGKPVFVSANASGTTFKNPDFFSFLENLLSTEEIDPRSFVLEVTEGILLENLDKIKVKLGHLRDLGIKVALDDFGTGYSSLQYISQLSIDYIKIDKSFMDQLFVAEKNSRMVQSIINMAEELSLGIVAEGVENEEQVQWLSENKNLKAQGYFFSRPVPMSEAESFLADAVLFEGLAENKSDDKNE